MNVFSERERQIVKIIGKKKMTLKAITEQLFKEMGGGKPFDEHISVGNSVIRIIKKCEYYQEDWTLVKTRENKKLYIKKEKVS